MEEDSGVVTATDQNYLKEIYLLVLDDDRATTSMLAARMGTSAATVTGQLKKLAARHLVEYSPYRGAVLTKNGRTLALGVVRRHRLVETFLSRVLGMPWDRVHAEAERLEHAVSEYLEDKLDEYLGRPNSDPHGSPIPTREGHVNDNGRLRLSALRPDDAADIVEVADRDPRLLAHLAAKRMRPGARLRVIAIEPLDGLITIEVAGTRQALGSASAGCVIVRRRSRRPPSENDRGK